MLFQPSNISPSEVNGTGAVDLSQDLAISWQVNGTTALSAYNITIYENNSSSTQKLNTGWQTLVTPFWGVDYAGNTQYYTATITAATLASNNITNGNEYKFIIQQKDTNNVISETSTASVFIGRKAPTVSITAITNPMSTYSYSFTGTYAQEQGDPIKWLRWQICTKDSEGNKRTPFYDTGRITGTGQLRCDYSGFLNGTNYSIKLDVETTNGQTATSGWTDFSVSYVVGEATGAVTACQQNDGSILITWPQVEAQGFDVFRLETGGEVYEKICSVGQTVGEIRDYSACSGTSYTWHVYPTGSLAYLTKPMSSQKLDVNFWYWVITETEQKADGTYTALANYVFRYGSGGVAEGSFSNNNTPTLQKNFTRYPTRQPDSANYLTGSVSGLIGVISKDRKYSDTLEQARALRELSTSTNELFLKDPKGHYIRIHTSQPVTMTINHKAKEMPQTVTLTWVEVGDTSEVKVTSNPTSTFWPFDNIIFTTIYVDEESGELVWTIPDNYEYGSTLTIENGILTRNSSDGYTVATMTMTGNELIATL